MVPRHSALIVKIPLKEVVERFLPWVRLMAEKYQLPFAIWRIHGCHRLVNKVFTFSDRLRNNQGKSEPFFSKIIFHLPWNLFRNSNHVLNNLKLRCADAGKTIRIIFWISNWETKMLKKLFYKILTRCVNYHLCTCLTEPSIIEALSRQYIKEWDRRTACLRKIW